MHIVKTWWHQQNYILVAMGTPVCSYCGGVTDDIVQDCDVIESNSIDNNAAILLVEKFKLLMNNDEWIAHVKKYFTTTLPN